MVFQGQQAKVEAVNDSIDKHIVESYMVRREPLAKVSKLPFLSRSDLRLVGNLLKHLRAT